MDDYDCLKQSSLKFKGEKRKKKSKKRSDKTDTTNQRDGDSTTTNRQQDESSEDAQDHGGWWKVIRYEDIKGEVVIEFLPGCYAKALSNGSIVLGNPHPPGEGPDEEEIFTAVPASTNQVAFKSGFGRYLSVDSRKRLMGLSEAIGEQDIFLPVFEDGKQALCAYNDCFLSMDEDSELKPIVARNTTVGPYEILNIRINNSPNLRSTTSKLDEQKVVDSGHQSYLERKDIKKARIEGRLHEVLLDKRTKQKSDKYCK